MALNNTRNQLQQIRTDTVRLSLGLTGGFSWSKVGLGAVALIIVAFVSLLVIYSPLETIIVALLIASIFLLARG